MRRTVDLGQCLLQATESQLQLLFAATASLNCLTDLSGETNLSPQWPDPVSAWIKAAPELELRFFVRFGPGLELIGSHLISVLEEMLCYSKVDHEGLLVSQMMLLG
jgi:hypothetical protein